MKRTIEAAAKQQQPLTLQKNPFFPDLLHQPDVVSVPRLGRLVAVYLYAPTQPVNWRRVLTAVEDLFEWKTSVQPSAVALAVYDFSHGVNPQSTNALEFLEQMFDLLLPVNNPERLTRDLGRAILDVAAKDRFFDLWTAERKRMSEQLGRFSEDRYRDLVDERRQPVSKDEEELISRVAIEAENLGLRPQREVLVRTPKEAIGGLPERSRFAFNLAFTDRHARQVLIDVVSFRRYGARPSLRYLMTKARFTSYEPIAYEPNQPFRLLRRREPLRRVLLIDGNLAGPKHDPYRYVRALMSVGWEIERAETAALPRLIDENLQERN